MAAVVHPLPNDWGGPRESRGSQAPPGPRLVDGTEQGHARLRPLSRRRGVIFRRRLIVVALAGGLVLALRPLVMPGGDPAVAPGQSTPIVAVANRVYVVQSGDTLWSIARRLQPGEDPRPVVDQLSTQVPGGVLRPGDRLVLP
jgi:hypothetical protein